MGSVGANRNTVGTTARADINNPADRVEWEQIQSFNEQIYELDRELRQWEDEYSVLQYQWQREANQKYQDQLSRGEAQLSLPDTNNARVLAIMRRDHASEIRQWEERLRNRRSTLERMNATLAQRSERFFNSNRR